MISFGKTLKHKSKEVESLEFFGGEPLIKRHFDILQTLVDKGRAKDISIKVIIQTDSYIPKIILTCGNNLKVYKYF